MTKKRKLKDVTASRPTKKKNKQEPEAVGVQKKPINLDNLKRPPSEFQKRLDELKKLATKTDKLPLRAARLIEAAENAGVTPTAAATMPELLARFKLTPERVSPGVVGYAEVALATYDRDLRYRVKQYNDKIDPPKPQPAKAEERSTTAPDEDNGDELVPVARKRKEDKGKARSNVFGFPVTAVLRWMGLDGFDAQEARACFNALGVEVADATIQIQLRAGKRGERGAPAQLTEEQQDHLRDLL